MASVQANQDVNLSGQWFNELGSNVDFRVHDGKISGMYHTAVTESDKEGLTAPLIGLAPQSTDDKTVVWTVNWPKFDENEGSTTIWMGQVFMNDGKEMIATSWFLRNSVKTFGQSWDSLAYNKDYFTRKPQITVEPSEDAQLRKDEDKSTDAVKQEKGITGLWQNDKGEQIRIDFKGNTEEITGQYTSSNGINIDMVGLGTNGDPNTSFSLLMKQQDENGSWSAIGMVGQRFEKDDKEFLRMGWMRRVPVDGLAQENLSTLVATEEFNRVQ